MNQNNKFELLNTLEILQNYNLRDCAESFKHEVAKFLNDDAQSGDMADILIQYKMQEHEKSYLKLIGFIESCDKYKYELSTLLYPVLVYMYLDLIENDRIEEANALMTRFGPKQKSYYQNDLKRISFVTKNHKMDKNDLIRTFKSNKFVLKIAHRTMLCLNNFLQKSSDLFMIYNIIKTNLHFEVYKGIIRNESQIDATLGGMMGTVTNNSGNTTRVFYGILPIQAIITISEDEEDIQPTEEPKSKRRKTKRTRSNSRESNYVLNPINDPEPDVVIDSNVPPKNRIPLPPLTAVQKMELLNEYNESLLKVVLGPKVLPSICGHTILNSNYNVNCATISEDLTMLAVGCLNSRIKVFGLTSETLKSLKSAKDLIKEIDLDDNSVDVESIKELMFDNSEAKIRTLIGHSDSVYSVSFSKNSKNLLSCSEDKTIRLWSLEIWCCVQVYKENISPVYTVKFSPFGHYFASASGDKTAKLWATDKLTPLRIFVGHFADVDCVQFHPNSNYVATGSSDRYVCLWDCLSGDQVRLMTGHKASIRSLEFSKCGRFLASAGNDTNILIWDIKFGNLVAALRGHKNSITAVSFSRCGNVLASSSVDGSLILWDFESITKDINLEDEIELHQLSFKADDSFKLKEYRVNGVAIIHLHFTLQNVLLSANRCNGNRFYNNFRI